MKMIYGSYSLAYPNISLIKRADSSMYLSTIAEETTGTSISILSRGDVKQIRTFQKVCLQATYHRPCQQCLPRAWGPV